MSDLNIFPDVFDQSAEHYAQADGFSSGTMSLDNHRWNRVFTMEVDDGTGHIHGRGETENTFQAEGYLGAQLMNDDPDADGTAEAITGQYRIVVRTVASDNRVDTIIRGSLGEIELWDFSNSERKGREDLQEFKQRENEVTTKEYYYAFEVKPKSDVVVDAAPASAITDLHVEGFTAEKTA